MMKVLFVASEVVPFAKTGGLADVAGTLPAAFDKEKIDARIVMPKYRSIPQRYTENMRFIKHIYLSLGWRTQYCGIYELEQDGVHVYFIENDFYFGGQQLYGYIHEDIEKFAFFSKAVLSILPDIGFKPDIIHCNDWQTALIPIFLRAQFLDNPFFHGIKTIMTIHNLKFQGIWGLNETKDATGLGNEYFTSDKLEFLRAANLLKGGLVYADFITTVSRTYAEEIKTEFFGEKLDGLLRARSSELTGIVNGISYTEYNPSKDPLIFAKYNRRDFASRKRFNKLELQKQLGLATDADAFLIGIVSRLTDQKGFDLISHRMEEICSSGSQLAVLGTGEKQYEELFRYYADKYPDRVSANLFFSNELAHKIYAASDAFLMPSLFEPCGLSQLISLRYGTIPIVRETGGLKDTVIPYNKYTKEGTGFSFSNYNAHEMLDAILSAKAVYSNASEWQNIVRHAMAQDFSWGAAALKYAELYDSLLK